MNTRKNDGTSYLYANLFTNLGTVQSSDFTRLRNVGADFVRVPIDPTPLLVANDAQRAAIVSTVLSALGLATRQGLKVVLDVHPNQSLPDWTSQAILSSPRLLAKYKASLVAFAAALAAADSQTIILELMNEPDGGYSSTESYSWLNTQPALVRAIRQVAPHLPLLLSGDRGDDYTGLSRVNPTLFKDPNLFYSFHYYNPLVVTHQGATWTNKDWLPFTKGITFPPSKGDETAELHAVQTSIFGSFLDPSSKTHLWFEARSAIAAYYAANHGIATVKENFATVSAWSSLYGIPPNRIVLGEFGVYRPGASHQTDVDYTYAVRKTAEDAGFAWAYYNYAPTDGDTASFSILRLQGAWPNALDPAIVRYGLGWSVP